MAELSSLLGYTYKERENQIENETIKKLDINMTHFDVATNKINLMRDLDLLVYAKFIDIREKFRQSNSHFLFH